MSLVQQAVFNLIQSSHVAWRSRRTDRVNTMYDIATQTIPTLFALSSSLVWDCKTSCTFAASGEMREVYPCLVDCTQPPQDHIYTLVGPPVRHYSLKVLECGY